MCVLTDPDSSVRELNNTCPLLRDSFDQLIAANLRTTLLRPFALPLLRARLYTYTPTKSMQIPHFRTHSKFLGTHSHDRYRTAVQDSNNVINGRVKCFSTMWLPLLSGEKTGCEYMAQSRHIRNMFPWVPTLSVPRSGFLLC